MNGNGEAIGAFPGMNIGGIAKVPGNPGNISGNPGNIDEAGMDWRAGREPWTGCSVEFAGMKV
jgi:hypothetical protein